METSSLPTARILFLAANPDGTTLLSLDKECRAIREKLRSAEFPKALKLEKELAVRRGDLLQYLREYSPHVVHFSGHGSPREELILLDESDRPKAVSKSALRALFGLPGNIRLVVLNACYSKPQADAIVEFIDCAVGMNKAISDRASIIFSAAFYRALGFGLSVKQAFDDGLVDLQIHGVTEESTPVLRERKGVDASQVFLAGPDANTSLTLSGCSDRKTKAVRQNLRQQESSRGDFLLAAAITTGTRGGKRATRTASLSSRIPSLTQPLAKTTKRIDKCLVMKPAATVEVFVPTIRGNVTYYRGKIQRLALTRGARDQFEVDSHPRPLATSGEPFNRDFELAITGRVEFVVSFFLNNAPQPHHFTLTRVAENRVIWAYDFQ
jgi:hypothetical protein